jgi:hypothetical protein
MWPFKNMKDRTSRPSFKVEVKAYLKPIKKHENLDSSRFNQVPIPINDYFPLTGEGNVPDFWDKDTSDPANCFSAVPVTLQYDYPSMNLKMVDTDSGGVIAGSGFTEGDPVSVALVVFARVKMGNEYVDSVPQVLPYPGIVGATDEFMATQQKIYFQTKPSGPVSDSMAVGQLDYDWTSLEVPDPRFNYKVANWIKSTDASSGKINLSTTQILGTEGRDGDIYMAVSDNDTLQSPGELGFIVRPFLYNLTGSKVDFRSQDAVNKSEDHEAMFRTIRLYDHGDPSDQTRRARDRIYDYFTMKGGNDRLLGARVNPLSDLPPVLAAAVDRTPLDYYWAGPKTLQASVTLAADHVFNKTLGNQDWAKFTNAWTKCLINARTAASPNINTSLGNNLSDLYGTQNLFGWYSEGVADRVFAGGYTVAGVPASLSAPLHEIDRKMLYSFSLDSFSDRQQLFLYILRAETTVPSFGGTTDSGVKSLAGGRAVALVWRDPYPLEYKKSNNTWLPNNNFYTADELRRVSPWYQHNINQYDTGMDDGDDDNTFSQRLDGYHQHRILFFKQLDN